MSTRSPGNRRPALTPGLLAVLAASVLTLAGCGAPQPTGAPVTDEVRAATEELFEGHTKAWAESPQAGWDFQVAHDYPGYANAGDETAQALRSRMLEAGYWESFAPDLTSITADPGWIPSSDGLACLASFDAPPKGDIYVVTVDRAGGETAGSAIHPSQRAQVHITLLDGRLYYFIPLCS